MQQYFIDQSSHNSSILGSFFANGQLNNKEKSRNGDTLGPVELFVWPEQGNQDDWREQDDQGEVSIIIFGISKSSGFQKK